MRKVWFVTGASRGIGAQIASAVVQAGHRLVATARRKDTLASLPQGTFRFDTFGDEARGQTVNWCERREFSNAAAATRSSRRTLRCH
jgi:NADP-dependent 3-hydroxy acid dehydrogenase YdfG